MFFGDRAMSEFRQVTRPYPGLRPFESWEAEIFFGRESHTDRLLEILQQQRFLTVIGPSGSGKSSLVRAGLIPSLPLGSIGTGSDWRIAMMRPGNRPMQRLAHALLSESALGPDLIGTERIPRSDRDITTDVAMVEAELRRGPHGLIDLVSDARSKPAVGDPFNLLVLVDQFEEIFTYITAGVRQADESEAFVNLLLQSRDKIDKQIFFILTMRSDFLGDCVQFLDLPDAINRSQYLTPRLIREEVSSAITGPAKLFGSGVEPTLVVELINIIGNNPDQLPILQHALARMWDFSKRRPYPSVIGWDDFNEVGGLLNALSNHGDQILNSLDPDKRDATEWLFRAVTEQGSTGAGNQAVRRPQSLKQIADWSDRSWEDFVPVVDAFTEEGVNFLNYNGALNESTVIDLSHEALSRQWSRLRWWVESEARRAVEYRRWRDRTVDHSNDTGLLLTGAPLLRAVEWLEGSDNGDQNWRPTERWATRYYAAENTARGQLTNLLSAKEFAAVSAFIQESARAVRAEEDARDEARRLKEDEERKRLESERLAAERIADAERARANAEATAHRQAFESAARSRRFAFIFAFMAVCVAGLAVFAWLSATRARDREITAIAASYWRLLTSEYLGSYRRSRRLLPEQADALLRLAKEERPVRERFIEQALIDVRLASNLGAKTSQITEAITGISPKVREWLLERIKAIETGELPEAILSLRALLRAELEDPNATDALISAIIRTTSIDQVNLLGARLEESAKQMPATMAVGIFQRLFASIKETIEISVSTTDNAAAELKTAKLQHLLNALAATPGTFTNIQAKNAIDALVAAMLGCRPCYHGSGWVERVIDKIATNHSAAALANTFMEAVSRTTDPQRLDIFNEGLRAVMEKVSEIEASAVADAVIKAIRETKNLDQLDVLGSTLRHALKKVPKGECEDVIRSLLVAIKTTTDRDQLWSLADELPEALQNLPDGRARVMTDVLFASIKGTTNRYQLYGLGEGLKEAVAHVPMGEAKAIAQMLSAATNATTDLGRLWALERGLTGLAGRISEVQAKPIADKLLVTIERTSNDFELSVLGREFAALALKVSNIEARTLADRVLAIIQRMIDRPMGTALDLTIKELLQLKPLGLGLASLAERVSDRQAKGVANRLIMLIKLTNVRDESHLRVLGDGLAMAVKRISAAESRTFAKTLLEEMQESNPNRREALGRGLEAAAGQLSNTDAEAIIKTLLEVHRNKSHEYLPMHVTRGLIVAVNQLHKDRPEAIVDTLLMSPVTFEEREVLREGIRAALEKVSDTQAKLIVDRLVAILKENPDEDLADEVQTALVLSLRKMTGSDAMSIGNTLIDSIKGTTNPEQLHAFGEGLRAVAEKLSEPEAQSIIATLLAEIQRTTVGLQLEALGEGIAAAAGRTRVSEASAKELIEFMKYPASRRKELTGSIRKSFQDAPHEREGFWAFIAWAQTKFPGLHVDSPTI
jgi:hypothetical protein